MPGFATRSHTRAEDSFLPQLVLQGENSFVSEMRRLQYCNSDLGTLVEFRADGTEFLQQFEGQGSWLARPALEGNRELPGSLDWIITQPGKLGQQCGQSEGTSSTARAVRTLTEPRAFNTRTRELAHSKAVSSVSSSVEG